MNTYAYTYTYIYICICIVCIYKYLITFKQICFLLAEPYRLVINNINADDSGKYGCKAANAVSYSISEESVTVECKCEYFLFFFSL